MLLVPWWAIAIIAVVIVCLAVKLVCLSRKSKRLNRIICWLEGIRGNEKENKEKEKEIESECGDAEGMG